MSMEQSKSLAPHTGQVFEAISKLECIKPFTLVGGTALSLQIEKRQSEDLDFELLGTRKERPQLDFSAISNAVSSIYPDSRKEFLGRNQLQIFVNGKVVEAELKDGYYIFTAFRDLYDIYALLKDGYDLEQGVAYAGRFSRHSLHSKTIYSILLNDNYFHKPENFGLLEPKYQVEVGDIVGFIKEYIEKKEIKIKK